LPLRFFLSVYDILTAMIETLDKMVLSASGWRGIFTSDGNGESVSPEIAEEFRTVAAAAAWVFADYLGGKGAPCVLVGTDTRPTGPAIAAVVIRVLLAKGCAVRFLGVAAAPEIMAAARHMGNSGGTAAGFLYISASHNPVGHNGIKFGLSDGGVVPGETAAQLAVALRSLLAGEDAQTRIAALLESGDEAAFRAVYARQEEEKKRALDIYHTFMQEVWTGENGAGDADRAAGGIAGGIAGAVRAGIEETPMGIVADLNGSARTVSIDRDFFAGLGIPFRVINGEKGKIAHRIVPEGESLVPCCRLLEEARRENPAFVLGYVCDCDGDRGNLVVWDEKAGAARPLAAQEVFALAVVAELAHLAWSNGGTPPPKTGVVVNGATSMRIDTIAQAFHAKTFHAETGEANVVALARRLREAGWTIRILGEGAAGGNITHPSAVRDPLATVMAIVKLLAVRNHGGLYRLWRAQQGCTQQGCAASGHVYRPDFTLSDIIESLPPFVTTSSYEKEAVLQVKTEDHALLKERYQRVFLREWAARKDELAARYGIVAYEAVAYKGTHVMRSCKHFRDAGRGGLRIIFFRDRRGRGNKHRAFAFIWMRGSGTEKAFRVMADVRGSDTPAEREFLAWQTRMVLEADGIR
jgi:phosphoglucomutase